MRKQHLLAGTFLCAVSTAQAQTVDLNLGSVTQDGSNTSMMVGFPWGSGSNLTLPNNMEQEVYEASNISTSNGDLTLTATPNTSPGPWPTNLPFVSGAVSTAGFNPNTQEPQPGGFQFDGSAGGTVSVTASVPTGPGLWPAIWLEPVSGTGACEVDLMEAPFNNPNQFQSSLHGGTGLGQVVNTNVPLSAMNTYSVTFGTNTLTYFFNGQEVAQVAKPADCNQPMYLLMNLAVGGTWPNQYGTPSPNTNASMVISKVTYTGPSGSYSGGLVDGAAPPAPTATAAAVSSVPIPVAQPNAPAPDPQSPVPSAAAPVADAAAASPPAVTPASGQVTDCSGNVWTISSATEGRRILENGAIVPGGGGTSAMSIQGCTVYGQDVHSGQWFTMSSVSSSADQYWTTSAAPPGAAAQVATAAVSEAPATSSQALPVPQAAAPPPLVCGAQTASGGFHVANGAIIGPDGKTWIARGINVYSDSAGASNPAAITQTFPGLNFVRYIVRSLNDPSTYDAFVTAMTSQGRVVEFEDHPDGGGDQDAGPPQGIPAESAWYAAMASHYKGNPYVWFGTFNEPMPTSNLSAWQRATYDAIRGTGSNALLMVEVSGSRPSNLQQALDPSVYTTMTDMIWDVHVYPYQNDYNPDPGSIAANINGMIAAAQKITSADGTVPVIIGESGPSTTGSGGPDPNGKETVEGLITVAASGTMGGLAPFTYYPGFDSPNDLTDSGGNLTIPYGQTAAIYINNSIIACSQTELAQGAQQTLDQLTQSVTGTASSAPSQASAPSVTSAPSASEADAQQQVDAIQAQIAATQAKLQAAAQ